MWIEDDGRTRICRYIPWHKIRTRRDRASRKFIPLGEACRQVGITKRTYRNRLQRMRMGLNAAVPFPTCRPAGEARLMVRIEDVEAYIASAVPVTDSVIPSKSFDPMLQKVREFAQKANARAIGMGRGRSIRRN